MYKNCLICEIKFKTYPSRVKKGGGKYCSRKCQFISQKGKICGKPFTKGMISPFLGRHHTTQSKEKNRLAHVSKGNIRYLNFKNCQICNKEFRTAKWNEAQRFCSRNCYFRYESASLIGEKNPGWRGGLSKIGQRLRTTVDYKLWRKAVFQRDNYICQICNYKSRTTINGKSDIQADHIKQFAYYPESRLDLSNGRTLCIKCHKKTKTFNNKLKREDNGTTYA